MLFLREVASLALFTDRTKDVIAHEVEEQFDGMSVSFSTYLRKQVHRKSGETERVHKQKRRLRETGTDGSVEDILFDAVLRHIIKSTRFHEHGDVGRPREHTGLVSIDFILQQPMVLIVQFDEQKHKLETAQSS